MISLCASAGAYYDGSIVGGGGVEGNDEMGVISLTEDGGEELAIDRVLILKAGRYACMPAVRRCVLHV